MSSYRDKKKKQNVRFRISFVFLFIIASFAVCFMLYMRGGDELPLKTRPVIESIDEPDDTSESKIESIGYESTAGINPVPESAMLDRRYFEKCMFAGDSLIVGLGTYGIIPEAQIAANIGMSVMSINDTPLKNADGTEILAADKINNAAPENLYVLLGLNLLGSYTEDQLLASYGDFIDSINREKTRIYIISVPPVTGDRENDETNPILNSDIDKFNSELLKFANDRGAYFVDLNTYLKGSDGRFPAEDAESDGIHFKKATYDKMLEFLLTHVYQGK